MEFMFWVWLAVIVITVIVEIITLDLVSIWFAFGAIVPFILSGIGGIPIEIQLIIFVVVSALLIIFVRKYAQKLLFKNMDEKTNVQSHTGKRFRLLEDTDFEKNGSIKINDVIWTAVSETGEKLEKGELVEIVRIEGNKMFVKKVEFESNSIDMKTLNEEKQNKQEILNKAFEEKSQAKNQAERITEQKEVK